MSDEKLKHLEFIQNIITRMNTNSFHLKGLCITIVSALLAIYCAEKNILIILSALFPLTVFWFLDTYYLMLERKFRSLYNDAIQKKSSIKEFNMNIQNYTKGNCNYWNTFFSRTIYPVYLLPSLLVISTYVYITYIA
ncbi:hypothetical protein C8N46_104294 [Kordia periserrulae]|uniref:Uncharacterized protein n=1 Tax=Kordia periserrulae TaxID=701523 RepID=A0A2T6C016_9FLAO|nr:hypothetical protein [Kordia periserrulae]PTX61650.1 hypothetical protein C8N46_104294 [Kordia periserrulae]